MIVWHDFAAFVAMGGYGAYVWGSFGMAAAAMAFEVLALKARRRALRASVHPTAEPRGPVHPASESHEPRESYRAEPA